MNASAGVFIPNAWCARDRHEAVRVNGLNLDTHGVELAISKGSALLTPYAGIGRVHVTSEPTGVAALGLRKESFDLDKIYAGLNINLGLINLAFGADQTGDAASYSAKFGFRF